MAAGDLSIVSTAVTTADYVSLTDGAGFTGGSFQVDVGGLPVRLAIAAAKPAVGVDTYILLTRGMVFPVSAMQAGVQVWGLAHEAACKVRYSKISRA